MSYNIGRDQEEEPEIFVYDENVYTDRNVIILTMNMYLDKLYSSPNYSNISVYTAGEIYHLTKLPGNKYYFSTESGNMYPVTLVDGINDKPHIGLNKLNSDFFKNKIYKWLDIISKIEFNKAKEGAIPYNQNSSFGKRKISIVQIKKDMDYLKK